MGGTFDRALAELAAGAKRTHWMWFVFPQLRGLGTSPTADFFGLDDLDGAVAYLAHPVLGARLRRAADTVLGGGRGRRRGPPRTGGRPEAAVVHDPLRPGGAGRGPLPTGSSTGSSSGVADQRTLDRLGPDTVA